MERPIIFSTEMVQAILEGRKTQTRRVIKPQNDFHGTMVNSLGYSESKLYTWAAFGNKEDPCFVKCPYGKKGDLLWVKETFGICPDYNQSRYKADKGVDRAAVGGKWKPSIFMPKKYCRLWLGVIDIRVERLQDISEYDAMCEGDPTQGLIASENIHVDWFKYLWDSINKERGYGWDVNPWMWVIEFRRMEKGEIK